MKTLRIISRSSTLARLQVDEALAALKTQAALSGTELPGFEVRYLESYGDRELGLSLLDGQAPADLFTRELDDALRSGQADFAVHSAKDLGLPLAADLEVYALLPAADQTDALVLPAGKTGSLASLPAGARIGTSSPQRRAELLALRPDLTVAGIRGTIESRLAQTDAGDFDAVIVATCALHRLGLKHRIAEILPFATHPLQGHLAVTGPRGRSDLEALWRPLDVRQNWGRVWLVGAGPGEPELLTLKAHRLLREADIIFNDSLANPVILEGLKAEIRYVGKRKDYHGKLQAEINELLYQAAKSGKKVVRLKGGDPMVFGRATEEMDYLEQRLVEIELVPGISSASAASSYTQIPLTEREKTTSVAYCLGYPPEKITAPDADALVYFMASSTLGLIVKKNLEKGKPADTPVALVHNASLPDQKMWISTLGQLREEIGDREDHPYRSPLLVFIGPNVRLGRLANWYQTLPLVWYTGTNPDHFTKKVRLIHQPLIRISPLSDWTAADAGLRALPQYDWAIFTSRYTVDFVFDRLTELGLDTRLFAGVRVAAVGQATARELAKRGLRADLVPVVESSEGLVRAFREGAGGQTSRGDQQTTPAESPIPTSSPLANQRIFLPCSDKALPVIQAGLTELGAQVDRVIVYQNVPVETAPDIPLEDLDEVVLTSPSTARAFAGFFPVLPARLTLTPMGAQTRRALLELFPGRPLGPALLNPDEK